MRKLILLCLLGTAFGQTRHTVPNLDTDNTFTGKNQFTKGAVLGPVKFADLGSLGAPQTGTAAIISDGSPGLVCAGGGTGIIAVYLNGAWNCSVSSGSAASFSSPPPLGNTTPNTVAGTVVNIVGSGLFFSAQPTCLFGESDNTLDEFEDVAGIPMWLPQGALGPCSQFLTYTPLPVGITPTDKQVPAWNAATGQFTIQTQVGGGGLSGMTAGQVPVAATATTVTSSKAIQGTDASLMSSGTVSGTGARLCLDANSGATTSGCSPIYTGTAGVQLQDGPGTSGVFVSGGDVGINDSAGNQVELVGGDVGSTVHGALFLGGASPTGVDLRSSDANVQLRAFASGVNKTAVLSGTAFTLNVPLVTTGATFSGISGSTQCLHVNTSGLLSGTGSDCGAGGATAWSAIGTPAGNLALTMAANTSTFNTTSAVSQFFKWANTTAALVGASQSSPILSLCGTEFHAAASAEGCLAWQFIPGTGTDAANTIALTHTGAATGATTTTFPGPIQVGSPGGAGGTITLPEGTTATASTGNDVCYGDSTAHAVKCAYNNGTFQIVPLISSTSTTVTQVLHATATAGVFAPGAIVVADIPLAIPIGNIGSAGLSGTAPVAISAAGAISVSAIPIGSVGSAGLSATSPVTIASTGVIAITGNGITATQLAAQYSKGSCTEVFGGSGTSFAMTSGDDAIANNACYNDSGVTRTITAVKCRSDNAANTTVLTPTFGSAGTGTAILTGTVTCGNSYAYSATGTVTNASWTTGSGIDPGMSTVGNATSIALIVEYTF